MLGRGQKCQNRIVNELIAVCSPKEVEVIEPFPLYSNRRFQVDQSLRQPRHVLSTKKRNDQVAFFPQFGASIKSGCFYACNASGGQISTKPSIGNLLSRQLVAGAPKVVHRQRDFAQIVCRWFSKSVALEISSLTFIKSSKSFAI